MCCNVLSHSGHVYLFMVSVLAIYHCETNYHKLSGLKQHVYYLTVSVGQESRHGLTELSAAELLTKLQSRCHAGPGSHLKGRLKKDQHIDMVFGSIQFPLGWNKGLTSLLAVEKATWQLASSKQARERKYWQDSSQNICNLITEMTCPGCWALRFVRSKLLQNSTEVP